VEPRRRNWPSSPWPRSPTPSFSWATNRIDQQRTRPPRIEFAKKAGALNSPRGPTLTGARPIHWPTTGSGPCGSRRAKAVNRWDKSSKRCAVGAHGWTGIFRNAGGGGFPIPATPPSCGVAAGDARDCHRAGRTGFRRGFLVTAVIVALEKSRCPIGRNRRSGPDCCWRRHGFPHGQFRRIGDESVRRSHCEVIDASVKPAKTPADYLVVCISPVLIMLLVGSLSFFLIQVFFRVRPSAVSGGSCSGLS